MQSDALSGDSPQRGRPRGVAGLFHADDLDRTGALCVAVGACPQPPRTAPTSRAQFGVLRRVHRGRLFGDRVHLLLQPLPTARGTARGVRGDLRAINRDRAQPPEIRPRTHQQHLDEQVPHRVLVHLPEAGDHRVVWYLGRADHPHRHVRTAQPLDLPRGPYPVGMGVDQQRRSVIGRPSVVASSWKSTAHTTFGASAVGGFGVVEAPRRLRRRRCGKRRPSSRHSRWIFLWLRFQPSARAP
jgi:hypothetical protein